MTTLAAGPGRDVVITGVGLVTPIGVGTENSWRSLLAGNSAAIWLRELFETGDSSRWAGMPVPGSSLREPFRLRKFALAAGEEALRHSGLTIGRDVDARQVGCVVGVSKSDLTAYSRWASETGAGDDDRDLIAAALLPDDASIALARRLGASGPALCPMAACATGLVSIIRGVQLIRDGACDAVLAGSVDASLTPALLGCYSRMKVLACSFENPPDAMRPFDAGRNGFLVGEGAGMLVLESADFAISRQSEPIAKVLGCALACDPTGLTDIDVTGQTLARVIRDALARSRLMPADVDAVQVHGTATWQNDLCEARALRLVWGEREVPPVISVKAAIGHLLGGAGSVETVFAALALRDQAVPPALNLSCPDRDCDLNLSPEARSMRLRRVLKLSLGFGGPLAAIVLERVT